MLSPYRVQGEIQSVDERLGELVDGMVGAPGTHRYLRRRPTTNDERRKIRLLLEPGGNVQKDTVRRFRVFAGCVLLGLVAFPYPMNLVVGVSGAVSLLFGASLHLFRDHARYAVLGVIRSQDDWSLIVAREIYRTLDTYLQSPASPGVEPLSDIRRIADDFRQLKRRASIPLTGPLPSPMKRASMYSQYLRHPSDALSEQLVKTFEVTEKFRVIAEQHLSKIRQEEDLKDLSSIQRVMAILHAMMDEMGVPSTSFSA